MNYRSIDDMNQLIHKNLGLVPRDVDLIIGIPRSGMLPASILSLYLNIPLISLDAVISEKFAVNIATSRPMDGVKGNLKRLADYHKILVIDDSCNSGRSIQFARNILKQYQSDTTEYLYTCVYATNESRAYVDFYFAVCEQPRVFEWNIMNHPIISNSCVDMDGVLCVDPTENENDDGEKYLEFLKKTNPLFIPKYPIEAIVTSRLEKYRKPTEEWLDEHGIEYRNLIMLKLASKEERVRLGAHATFKALVYEKSNACLFIESDPSQAKQINAITNKPAYCVTNGQYYNADNSLELYLTQKKRVDKLKAQIYPMLDTLKGLQDVIKNTQNNEEYISIAREAIQSILYSLKEYSGEYNDRIVKKFQERIMIESLTDEMCDFVDNILQKFLCGYSGKVTEKAWAQEVQNNKNRILRYIYMSSEGSKFNEEITYIRDKAAFMMYPYEFTEQYKENDIAVFEDHYFHQKYVWHNGKKLYFPISHSDTVVRQEYNQLIMEQDINSPHHYFSQECSVSENTIFIDVGSAEGIISLDIIEKVKEVFLIECDPEWQKVLELTFAPYQEKVHFIPKFAGRFVDDSTITLDSLLNNYVDEDIFIKMDIEGMELDALKGAKKVLLQNNCALSCTTYHTDDALKELKAYFEDQNYNCKESRGYMLFPFGKMVLMNGKYNRPEAPFFRRGLIRAWKNT